MKPSSTVYRQKTTNNKYTNLTGFGYLLGLSSS